jgi:hypothetical protein
MKDVLARVMTVARSDRFMVIFYVGLTAAVFVFLAMLLTS